MTPEELLKPRVKMIAPIPKMFSVPGIEVGKIWTGEEVGGKIIFHLSSAHRMDLEAIKGYPHLFQPLAWWEDRKPEDLPHYVKDIDGNVYKAVRYEDLNGRLPRFYTGKRETKGRWKGFEEPFNIAACVPATEADYQSFIQKQKEAK